MQAKSQPKNAWWEQPAAHLAISIGSLACLFVLAYLLDLWYQGIRGDLVDLLVVFTYMIASLLFATAGLTLFWYILVYSKRNRAVTITTLVVGLLVILYPALHLLTPVGAWFPLGINVIMPGSHVYFAGGFAAGMGLLSLTLPVAV